MPPEDLISDFRKFRGADDQDRAHANLLGAREIDPEKAAKFKALGDRWGVGITTAEKQQPALERAARIEADKQALSTAPATSRFLAKDPSYAAVSHDHVSDLTSAEVMAQRVAQFGALTAPKQPRPTIGSYLKGQGTALSTGLEMLRASLMSMGYDIGGGGNAAERETQLRKFTNADFRNELATPAFKTRTAGAIYGGVSSTLQTAPAVAMSVLTRNPMPALAVMGAQSGLQQYGKVRARGGTPGEAAASGMLTGGIEAGTELIPMGFLAKRFGDKGLKAFIGGMLARELPTEQVATFLQDAVDTAIANPDKTWGEFWAERPGAAFDTAVSTVTQSLIMGGLSEGAARIARKDQTAAEAPDALKAFNEFATAVSALPLRQRSPEAFQALVSELAPGVDVHVNAEALTTYLQSLPPEEASTLVESLGVEDQIKAATPEVDIVIPMASYMQHIAPTEGHKALEQDIKLGTAGMSVKEAEAHQGEREQLLAEAAAKVLDTTTAQAPAAEARQRVYDDFLARSVAAGVPEEQAKANAAVQASYYEQRAARNTAFPDAWAAYQEAGVTIQGPNGQGAAPPAGPTFSLEQVSPEIAKRLPYATKLPSEPLFAEAVQNTPGAELTPDGLLIALERHQKPEQAGSESPRTGVFYLPAKSANRRYYRTPTNHYGGTDTVTGQTLLRAPLFVKGATGGRAPEAAYEAVRGKGSAKELERQIMHVVGGMPALRKDGTAEEAVAKLLEEQGGNPDLAYHILRTSTKGNQLRYALQEHVIAHVVRDAGYDSVVGYSKGKAGGAISEVFDVREAYYPEPGAVFDPGSLHPTFEQSADANGMVTLSHWSSKGRIKQLDPMRFGDNYEILSDEEKMTLDEAIPRTYWGVGTGQPGEYTPEDGIGPHRYEAKMPLAELYDGTADPQGFRAKAEAQVRADVGEQDITDYEAEVILAFEKSVLDAGYKGYMTQGGSTHTGPVAAVFENPKHTYKGRDKTFAQTSGPTTIDAFKPENLPSLLERDDWTIMTAENPAARTDLTPEENAALNTELEAELQRRGLEFHKVEGHYGQRENSYIILGITETEALGLGQQFGQESVLTRRGLVYADGTYQPATGITVHDTAPEDFYSYVPETGGLFSVDINFDQRLPLPATMAQGPRGQVSFSDQGALIQLFKTRNASTLIHEGAGHIWLENLGRDAADPNASDEVRADLETVKAWWRANIDQAVQERGQNGGVGALEQAIADFGTGVQVDTDAIRPFHEMFARAAERYFMEGKSPTPELRGAFTRFRNWLVAIYKDFTKLNVPMTDDIRGVFDRLIAVPQELESVAQDQGLTPFFKNAASAGFTPAEYAAYLTTLKTADETAHDRLLGKVMGDIRRKYTAAWKAERETLVEEFQTVVDETPEMQALTLLESGEVRLQRDAVVGMAEGGEASLYRRQRPYVFDEGLHPDDVAEQVGLPSGQSLVDALVAMKGEHDDLRANGDKRTVRKARAERLADAEMLARHGDILNDGTIGDEAIAALNDLRRSEVLMAEVRALVRKAGAITTIWSEEEMQSWARAQVAARRLDGIRPHIYAAAEAKAGRDALKALVKDDFQGALDAKFRQLLNMHLYRAARDAREQIDKGKTLFERIAKAKNGTISKTRNMDMVGAARAVLTPYGFAAKANDADYMAKVKLYDPELWADLEVSITAALAGAKPLDELTYDEFASLREIVTQLWEMSRVSKQMEIDFQALEIDDITTELADQLKDPKLNLGPTHNATGRELIARTVQAWRAHMRRVESWVSSVDGGQKGPFRTYIWQPISEAATRYRLAKNEYLTAFVGLLEPMRASLKRGKIEAPELNHVFGASNNGVGKSELLHAILHTGNESNKRKLLLGRQWATERADGTLDTSAWDKFVDRMHREGVLTQADYDFAQSVWDLLERMKPDAQKAHRRVFGRYFEEVTANSFNTPFGTYAGGYVPALVDPFIVQDAALKAGAEAVEEGNSANMFPSPARGFTKSRVEYNRPLALDLGLLPQHIDKVLKFTHMTAPVRDVLRLLKAKGLSAKLEALDPTAVTDMLLPWLNRSARQVVETPSTSTAGRKIDSVMRAVRSRSGMGIMMFNLSNTVQQLTGWFPASLRVKKRHLTRALWNYTRNADHMADDIASMSPFMATRTVRQMLDVGTELDNLLLDPSKYQKAVDFSTRHAYLLQGQFQNLVDLVTWQASFEQAIEEGQQFDEAVRSADSAIRETQGSLSPEDVSAWETGSALKRLFTQFYSYFSAQGNLIGTELGNTKTLSRAGYVYLMGVLLPAVVSEVIRRSFGAGWDDDDDDGYLDMFLDLFFGSQFRYATGALPIVGQLVNLVANQFNDKRFDDQLVPSPTMSTVQSAANVPHDLYKLVAEGKGQKATVRDTATLLTLATGIPLFNVAARPLGYLADMNEGKVQPTGPVDLARGLVTGTASSASKVN